MKHLVLVILLALANFYSVHAQCSITASINETSIDVCDDATSAYFTVNISGGIAPYSMTLTAPDNSEVFIIDLLDGDNVVELTDIQEGEYLIDNVTGEACQVYPEDKLIVNYIQPLEVNNLGETCDKFSGTFTVDLDISSGIPPYTINGEEDINTQHSGTGIFTSHPIAIMPGSEAYSFDITDASGCTSGELTVTSPYSCDCFIYGSIGAVDPDFCEGEATDIVVNISGGNVGDYTVEYTYTPLSTGISESFTKDFTGDQTGAVLTTVDESGTITLTNIYDSDCAASFWESETVTSYSLPEVSFTGGSTICDDGSEATLTITGIQGNGEWSGVYETPSGTPVNFTTSSGYFSFNTSQEGTYTIESITDLGTSCVNVSEETTEVIKELLPEINDIRGSYFMCLMHTSQEVYEANVNPNKGTPHSFEWEISVGDIVSGQGTDMVTVEILDIYIEPAILSVTPIGCAAGITTNLSIEFLPIEQLNVSIDNPGILCENGGVETFTTSVSNTSAAYSINWYLNDELLSNSGSLLTTSNYSNGDKLSVEVFSSYYCTTQPYYTDEIELEVIDCGGATGLLSNHDQAIHVTSYPNPSSGLFQIDAKLSGVMQLYAMNGELLREAPLTSGTFSLDLSAEEKGIYLLKCVYDNGLTESLKLIKE